jgi:hypothetical protein
VNATNSVTGPCDQVAVTFTRDQVLALFGLLQWANQHSRGLAVKGDVRDAWVQLSATWAKANPARQATRPPGRLNHEPSSSQGSSGGADSEP